MVTRAREAPSLSLSGAIFAMAVGVIADVSNNEDVKFKMDESFIGTSFLVVSA